MSAKEREQNISKWIPIPKLSINRSLLSFTLRKWGFMCNGAFCTGNFL